MTRILKIPFLPFLIFRNKKFLSIGIVALVGSWILSISLDLSYSPILDRLVESGHYDLSDTHKGIRSVSEFEWYLRATVGRLFYIFHWWIHASILFSFSSHYFLEVEAKENPKKAHHSKIVIVFFSIFPLACYYAIFLTIDWWKELIFFLM